jgi:hypothetical protein
MANPGITKIKHGPRQALRNSPVKTGPIPLAADSVFDAPDVTNQTGAKRNVGVRQVVQNDQGNAGNQATRNR